MQSGGASKIIVVGELNVDLVASGLKIEPVLGREILADDFEITLGSASAIFASGIARLGERVTFISLIGRDQFGEFCKQALEERGISIEYVLESDQSRTGVTLVMSTSNDRALVTYLGAIAELEMRNVPLEALAGHNHIHLTSFYLQTGLQADFPSLMATAKERGLTTSFDPNSDPDQGDIEKIKDVLRQTDILFVNEDEANLLTSRSDVRAGCVQLAQFCPFVVVKLGSKGSIAYRNGEFIQAGGFDVQAVDTTGAGDSFAAGFVHAYLAGRDTRECLTIGNACGAISATKPGGTTGQPDKEQLHRFLSGRSIGAL